MSATFVPLKNLDDRRWADLVDEGRSLIPVYAPSWTDHNAHDPGITLLELLAWIAESDIYRVDRIPDSHIRAFLALIGLSERPPVAARAAVSFALKKGSANPVTVPARTLLDSPAGPFQVCADLSVLPATLAAVKVTIGGTSRDVTADWQRGKPIALFGSDPRPGDSFCLGFDAALPGGSMLGLHIALDGARAGAAERQRMLDEITSIRSACAQLSPSCCGITPAIAAGPELPPHHSATVIWEVLTSAGVWQQLNAVDDTRSLTLSGRVRLALPSTVPWLPIGNVRRRTDGAAHPRQCDRGRAMRTAVRELDSGE
jgi:predicted phage baseplate assembly protein